MNDLTARQLLGDEYVEFSELAAAISSMVRVAHRLGIQRRPREVTPLSSYLKNGGEHGALSTGRSWMTDLQLARMLLEERIHRNKPWWQEARASRLADILDGVADAPDPIVRFFDNLAEEVQGDHIVAYDVAGLLLDNVEVVKCALARGARQ
jgi:hypothetical protein